jgi:hypothetical protein
MNKVSMNICFRDKRSENSRLQNDLALVDYSDIQNNINAKEVFKNLKTVLGVKYINECAYFELDKN